METHGINWQDPGWISDQISTMEKNWLLNKESLTERLVLLSQDRFSLQVLSDGQQQVREDECSALSLSFPRQERVREVILQGDLHSWVYARTVIMSYAQQQNDPFHKLGHQPLGTFLFRKNAFDRSLIEVARYPISLLPLSCRYADLWGRRSIFTGQQWHVLVQEVFLPDFWDTVSRQFIQIR